MKHLKSINELMTAHFRDRATEKDLYYVAWNNGNIMYQPTSEELLEIPANLH